MSLALLKSLPPVRLTAAMSGPPAIPGSHPEFERCNDPAKLNALLNHPRIRPHMGGEGELDGTPLLGVFYLSDHGGMLFHESDPGLWEGHWLFTARAPYGTALAMVHRFVYEMNPKLLWGRVPVGNRPARLFTRKLGFTSFGIRERPFPAEIFVWGRSPCHLLGKSSAV